MGGIGAVHEYPPLLPNLPSIDRRSLGLRNAITTAAGWEGEIDGQYWQFKPFHPTQPPADAMRVPLFLGERRMCLSITRASMEVIFTERYGAEGLSDLPEELVLALVQDTIDVVCAAWVVGGEIRVDMSECQPAAAQSYDDVLLGVHITMGQNKRLVTCYLSLDATTLEQFQQSQLACDPGPLDQWLPLPIALTFLLGWIDLPLAQLTSLRVNDVVVPDVWWHQDGQRIWASLGSGIGFDARLVDCISLHVTSQVKHMTEHKDEESNIEAQSEATAAGVSLLDVPVRVNFDLGACTITLGELRQLQPGHIFEPATPPQRGVNLRVNGVQIGEGELVNIDGLIGVVVTRIVPPKP